MGKTFVKKAVTALLLLVLVFGALPANKAEAAPKPKLSATRLNLTVGKSKQLKVRNTKAKVKWSSNKKSVATVTKNGKVTAKKAGKATISAKIGKTRLKCTVTVTKKKGKNKVLVAYFSATGSTERVAKFIQGAANADIYKIQPRVPYTDDDLDYTESSSRVVREHESGEEPAISGKINNISQYDVIFIGYPVWWQEAPNIMHTFLKSHNLSGKTIIPFCTSASSGIGSSAKNLQRFAPDATWQTGRRFDSYASKSSVEKWVKSLSY